MNIGNLLLTDFGFIVVSFGFGLELGEKFGGLSYEEQMLLPPLIILFLVGMLMLSFVRAVSMGGGK